MSELAFELCGSVAGNALDRADVERAYRAAVVAGRYEEASDVLADLGCIAVKELKPGAWSFALWAFERMADLRIARNELPTVPPELRQPRPHPERVAAAQRALKRAVPRWKAECAPFEKDYGGPEIW